MNAHLKTLADEALKLPSGEREALVQILIASIDDGSEVEAAWAAEIERRADELDNGSAQAIPLADALAQLRSRLK
jgi:putative addiction module component (TIGR02574 family)